MGIDATAVRAFLTRHAASDISDNAKAKYQDGGLFGKSTTLGDGARGTVDGFSSTSTPASPVGGAGSTSPSWQRGAGSRRRR